MRTALDLLYVVFLSPILLGYVAFLVLVRRRGIGSLRERMGAIPHLRSRDRRRRIWLHAVSVGELEAARPLIDAIETADDLEVVVSVTTASARELAERRFGADRVFYFPLDLSWFVKRTLRAVEADLVVLMELEIWPNHILGVRAAGLPLLVSNGRVSERGFRRMSKVRFFFAPLLRKIDRFLVQTSEYEDRLRTLGVDPDRIDVVGNLKFDRPAIEDRAGVRTSITRRFSPELTGRWWVAGSTHPGEETAVLDAQLALRDRFPGLGLLLAPRHVERAPDVAELARARDLEVAFYSDHKSAEVIVVDVVGELATLYALGEVAFVGGSLVPIGGHNILEPIAAGTDTMHGAHLHNFRTERRLFTEGGASRQVDDGDALARAVADAFESPEGRETRVARGFEILAEHRGAAGRTLAAIQASLPSNDGSR